MDIRALRSRNCSSALHSPGQARYRNFSEALLEALSSLNFLLTCSTKAVPAKRMQGVAIDGTVALSFFVKNGLCCADRKVMIQQSFVEDVHFPGSIRLIRLVHLQSATVPKIVQPSSCNVQKVSACALPFVTLNLQFAARRIFRSLNELLFGYLNSQHCSIAL